MRTKKIKKIPSTNVITCLPNEIKFDYKKVIKKFSNLQILVIGDLMVDEYLIGKCKRISPEAPVPIVEVSKREYRLGGASNVSNNLRSLNANVSLCAVIGNDGIGRLAIDECKKSGIQTNGIFIDKTRPTTLKTRIIAHNQQIARTDIEKTFEIDENIRKKIIEYINDNMNNFDAIILSDYAKGVINKKLLDNILPLFKKHGKIVNVDPKILNFYHYRNVTCITPNRKELSEVLGYEIENENELLTGGQSVLNDLTLNALLVTLGEQGMCLFTGEKNVYMFPACAKSVYDVTGAGDTVIAIFTLALALGLSFKEAAMISNIGAGEVVSKFGTATLTPEELICAIDAHVKK